LQSGPVKARPTSQYSSLLPLKDRKPIERTQAEEKADAEEDDGGDDEELSEIDEELDDDEEEDEDENKEQDSDEAMDDQDQASPEDEAGAETEEVPEPKKERKRKRKDEFDDLESKYMRKLVDDEEEDQDKETPSEKRRKGEAGKAIDGDAPAKGNEEEDDETPIIHESLMAKTKEEHGDVEIEKANRTLFLGNVSAEAVTSKKAKKQLMEHLASPLADLDEASGPHKVESLRFRSTAFAGGGMPKRAAYITKSVMSATTHSTNAYVVYSTAVAARAAVRALNGTVVLDRHLRADSVAHPTPTAHRRCVFVGNLGFVDDETVLNTDHETGETKAKKRNKVPADVEEGLWRVFGKHAGAVEGVRVPRDPATRVGKGFAYVQFRDGNSVEAALLLDGKKFPPMLPRALRVSRAKDPRKTTLAMERTVKARLEAADAAEAADGKPKSTKYKHKATPEQQSLAGRAGRLLGRAGAARQARELRHGKEKYGERRGGPRTEGAVSNMPAKTPEQIVFEGRRASARDGKPKDLKFGKGKGKGSQKKGPGGRPIKRGERRAVAWRKKDKA
jgi:nucleolar protein 12